MARRLILMLGVLLLCTAFTSPAGCDDDQSKPHDDHLVQCHEKLQKCVEVRNQFLYASVKCSVAARMVVDALLECEADLEKQGVRYEVLLRPLCTFAVTEN